MALSSDAGGVRRSRSLLGTRGERCSSSKPGRVPLKADEPPPGDDVGEADPSPSDSPPSDSRRGLSTLCRRSEPMLPRRRRRRRGGPSTRRTFDAGARRRGGPPTQRTSTRGPRREDPGARTVDASERRPSGPSIRRTVDPADRRSGGPSTQQTVGPADRRRSAPSTQRAVDQRRHDPRRSPAAPRSRRSTRDTDKPAPSGSRSPTGSSRVCPRGGRAAAVVHTPTRATQQECSWPWPRQTTDESDPRPIHRANVIHRSSPGSCPQRWTTAAGQPHRCGQLLGKSMWTSTQRDIPVHRLWRSVDCLLKVLGTTSR